MVRTQTFLLLGLILFSRQWVGPDVARAATLDRLEASVNSSLILASDVKRFRDTVGLRAQLDPLFAGTSIAAEKAAAKDADIIQFLIDERLIAQAFPVTDAEVEQEISSIQSTNKIDRASLKNALREQGYTFDDYFNLIRTSAAKRNLIDRDIRTKVTISDEDVKNHFYNHKLRSGAAPTAYRIHLIALARSTYKNPGVHRVAAEDALKAIRAGEAFADVARRVSDDPSKETGGDLGTLTDDQMNPAFKAQVKKLKLGEISDVFGNPAQQLFILKLVDVASDDTGPLNKQKEEIRSQLTAQEYSRQIALWLERQRQTAFIHRAGEPSIASLPKAP